MNEIEIQSGELPRQKSSVSPPIPQLIAAKSLGPGEWFVWTNPPKGAYHLVYKWRNRDKINVRCFKDDQGRVIVAHKEINAKA